MDSLISESLLKSIIQIAEQAGKKILEVYERETPLDIQIKMDQSPVTEADRLAHENILSSLLALDLGFPILSEEAASIDWKQRKQWTTYWLIDPLDGTKEFIHGGQDFTVNIALIHEHKPCLGVVHVPVTGATYFAAEGLGAFRQTTEVSKIHIRKTEKPTILGSRRHATGKLNDFLTSLPPHEFRPVASSLKFCLVAEGEADLYPRLGPTSEWDTAAGQCVLEQAGGQVMMLTGEALQYNTKDSLLNPCFIAQADPDYNWLTFFPEAK